MSVLTALVVDWPWMVEHASLHSVRSPLVIVALVEALAREDQHVQEFDGLEYLTSVEYGGFPTVLNAIFTRDDLSPGDRQIVDEVRRCVGPFMLPGVAGSPVIIDLELCDGVFAVLSPNSVSTALQRFRDAPLREFRPLYESSPALVRWSTIFADDSPEIEFDDFLNFCDAWIDLLKLAQEKGWGVICYS